MSTVELAFHPAESGKLAARHIIVEIVEARRRSGRIQIGWPRIPPQSNVWK